VNILQAGELRLMLGLIALAGIILTARLVHDLHAFFAKLKDNLVKAIEIRM